MGQRERVLGSQSGHTSQKKKFEKKNFRIIKSRPNRNRRDQYFERIFRKNLIKFYKKFEEQSQKIF